MLCILSPVSGMLPGGHGRIFRGRYEEIRCSLLRALGAPDQPSQEGHQEQNKKNEEQKLRDSCGRESNASETENRGDNRDYEKS